MNDKNGGWALAMHNTTVTRKAGIIKNKTKTNIFLFYFFKKFNF
jgi:hypothetical protein